MIDDLYYHTTLYSSKMKPADEYKEALANATTFRHKNLDKKPTTAPESSMSI
jgi:hypothetical protein